MKSKMRNSLLRMLFLTLISVGCMAASFCPQFPSPFVFVPSAMLFSVVPPSVDGRRKQFSDIPRAFLLSSLLVQAQQADSESGKLTEAAAQTELRLPVSVSSLVTTSPRKKGH